MNSHEVFIHIHQGCFAGTGAIVRLPQCQWSKPDGYGKISQCKTTTKKAQQSKIRVHIYWDILYLSGRIKRIKVKERTYLAETDWSPTCWCLSDHALWSSVKMPTIRPLCQTTAPITVIQFSFVSRLLSAGILHKGVFCVYTTVYPKKYAHGFCFAVLCCGYTLTDFPISIRLTSLALWQSNDCPSAGKATLMNMDKYFMWIHYERLHNHNKAKHNKTVCIFLGIYCISSLRYHMQSHICLWRYLVLLLYKRSYSFVISLFSGIASKYTTKQNYNWFPHNSKRTPYFIRVYGAHVSLWYSALPASRSPAKET